MKKWHSYGIASLAGISYGLTLLLLSRFLICNLGGLFSGISAITGVTKVEEDHIVQILDQLKTAHIVSPWAVMLLLGIALGAVYFS